MKGKSRIWHSLLKHISVTLIMSMLLPETAFSAYASEIISFDEPSNDMIYEETVEDYELLLSDEAVAQEEVDEVTPAGPVLADPVSEDDELLSSETMTVSGIEELSGEDSIISGTITPEGEGEVSENIIELNQAFSMHPGLNDPTVTYLNTFVANKSIAVTMLIPGSDGMNQEQATAAKANYSLEVRRVTNGVEADGAEYAAESGDYISVNPVYDNLCVFQGWHAVVRFTDGFDKGTYNVHWFNGEDEIAVNEGVTFYETKKLNILVVPVKGYWGNAIPGQGIPQGVASCKDGTFKDVNGNDQSWDKLVGCVKEYLLDVYPVAQIEVEEGSELDAGSAKYDLQTDDGMWELWQEACKRQAKTKEGKDKYDLILAFVQYRQDNTGSGQGYTYGRPSNIITYSDGDMLPTVAHEIAHCYNVGDEYDGGSINNKVNYSPEGFGSRDLITGNPMTSTGVPAHWKSPQQYSDNVKDLESGDVTPVVKGGSGTIIPLSQHPYSFSQEKFITWGNVKEKDDGTGHIEIVSTTTPPGACPTMSYMGSGYSNGADGYYWTTTSIWDHLFKEFVKKDKKGSSSTGTASLSQLTNAEVFANAESSGVKVDGASIFTDDEEFYYDDDYRFGESRMVEVSGYLDRETQKIFMDPMFSYDGDLEYIDVLDDEIKDADPENIFVFAAVDANGKVIKSSVDGELSVAEQHLNFFNPSNPDMDMRWKSFSFDAEYPEGTKDFIMGRKLVLSINEVDGSYRKDGVMWKLSDTGVDINNSPDGFLDYGEVNDRYAEVEWEVYYPEDSETPYTGKDKDGHALSSNKLYTEVYYLPEGDDGEAIYVGCSDDEDWEEGYYTFDTAEYGWTRNAYVWLKITNGVNALDIYSDENDITLCNSTITLSGKGIKKIKNGTEITYSAEYTGNPITPKTAVKALNPESGGYLTLKEDLDYTVSYEENTDVGTAKVIVQGIGLYAGKNVQEFEIVKKKITGKPQNIPNLTYAKDLDKAIRPHLIVIDTNNKQLVYDTDFAVKYTSENKIKKDTVWHDSLNKMYTSEPSAKQKVTVMFEGKGNYEDVLKTKIKFEILPAKDVENTLSENGLSGNKVVITLKATSFQYTGKAIKPKVKSVKIGDKVLKSANYKVVYTNNVGIGKGRVTIIGTKKTTGSAYATFDITAKKVKGISVSRVKNQPYTGKPVDIDSLPLIVKAGSIVLRKNIDYKVVSVNDCEYTNVTTPDVKRDKRYPKIQVMLISASKSGSAAKKPLVEWDSTVKEEKKVITKAFSIVATNLGSAAVSYSLSSNTLSSDSISGNKVMSSDGKKVLGTIRTATQEDRKGQKKKFLYVIEGSENILEKNVIIEGQIIRAYGKELKKDVDYTCTVGKVAKNKIGTIVITAKKGSTNYKGTKKIMFKYVKKASE